MDTPHEEMERLFYGWRSQGLVIKFKCAEPYMSRARGEGSVGDSSYTLTAADYDRGIIEISGLETEQSPWRRVHVYKDNRPTNQPSTRFMPQSDSIHDQNRLRSPVRRDMARPLPDRDHREKSPKYKWLVGLQRQDNAGGPSSQAL